jgi:hypothetical protein
MNHKDRLELEKLRLEMMSAFYERLDGLQMEFDMCETTIDFLHTQIPLPNDPDASEEERYALGLRISHEIRKMHRIGALMDRIRDQIT